MRGSAILISLMSPSSLALPHIVLPSPARGGAVNGSDRPGVALSNGRLDAEQRRRLAANLYLLISTAPDDAYMAVANMLPLDETEKFYMNRQHPSLRLMP
jgi:hypothetical protein